MPRVETTTLQGADKKPRAPRKAPTVFERLRLWNHRYGPRVRLERIWGRRVFGNGSGFSNNLRGRRAIREAQAACAIPQSDDPAIAAFHRDGFALLPQRLDISAILPGYLEQIEHPQFSKSRGTYSRMIRAPEKTMPAFEGMLSDYVRDVMTKAYRSYFSVFSFHPYRTRHVPAEEQDREVYSNYWHFDWRSTAQYRIFFLLSDVTEADGPFLMNTVARSKALVHSGKWVNRNDHDAAEANRQAFKFTGPAGTAVICNTTICMHRASIPEPGRVRDLCSVQFMPAATPLRRDWLTGFYQNP